MAVDYYKKAIKNLEERRKSNPYITTAKTQVGQLAPEFGGIQRKLETSLRVGGASPAAQLQAAQSTGQQYEQTVGAIYEEAGARQEERVAQINQKVDELKLQRDIAKQQEKEQEDARKKGLWQTGAQVLGAGVGAIVGGLPGAQIGASLGGAVGSAAGAFVGDEVDPNMLMQSAADAVSGFSSMSQLKQDKKLSSALGNFIETTKDMPSEQLMQVYQNAQMLYSVGDVQGLIRLFGGE